MEDGSAKEGEEGEGRDVGRDMGLEEEEALEEWLWVGEGARLDGVEEPDAVMSTEARR